MYAMYAMHTKRRANPPTRSIKTKKKAMASLVNDTCPIHMRMRMCTAHVCVHVYTHVCAHVYTHACATLMIHAYTNVCARVYTQMYFFRRSLLMTITT